MAPKGTFEVLISVSGFVFAFPFEKLTKDRNLLRTYWLVS